MKTLILHNIRSAHNVGAMFRTAEAIGIDHIVVSGYSASPTDRFGREDTKVTKAAVNAHELISWVRIDDVHEYLVKLLACGTQLVAIEQHPTSQDYKTYAPPEDIAIVMGNEVTGVEPEILELCDTILELPMYGEKESLNVATTCGIVLYRLFDHD